MFTAHDADAFTTPHPWATGNENWQSFSAKSAPLRRLRQRNPMPLILCGHGVSLRVDGGALAVRDGFTHYPQEQQVHRLFPGDLALPPRIILLDGSGTLSFDVLSWLAEQSIPLARVKWTGEVATVGGRGLFDRAKVDWQRETRADEGRRLAFAADLIRQKLLASLPTLQGHVDASRCRDMAIAKAEAGIERLRSIGFRDMNNVFAIEGECAAAYFAAWKGMPTRWTGTTRKPVPEQWRTYAGRSSLATGVKPENRNASHPVNALLNYAYAVKLAHVQIDAVSNGYDPMLGIMHNGRKGSPGWALDMIEPHRPVVDAAILSVIREQRFAAADFTMRRDGVCRVSPQLARVVATLVSATGDAGAKASLPGAETGASEAGRSRLVRFSPARLSAPPQASRHVLTFPHRREQFAHLHGQRGGELIQHVDGRVLSPAFHATDVGSINASVEGQPLLRDIAFHPQTPKVCPYQIAPTHGRTATFSAVRNHGL